MNMSIRERFNRSAIVSVALLTLALSASAQGQPLKIDYRLAMSQPSSHLFEVTIEVRLPDDAKPDSLDLQMAKWSPGRYAVFDFAKNVQEFRALLGICPETADCTQADAPITRMDDQTWRVSLRNTHSATITYKVFGNDLSGTFSQLDSRHANFNGGSIFMYVVNHKQDPVGLSINPPPGWRIVNGRIEKRDQREWHFPNWDIMTDTPTEIAPDWTQDTFTVDGKQYHVVLHAFGKQGTSGRRWCVTSRNCPRRDRHVGPPEFDSYTFLIHFANDGHSGDGMEHLTSTQIIQPGERQRSDAIRRRAGHCGPRVFSRVECKAFAADRAWALGLHAACKYARPLDRRRHYELLRPPDDAPRECLE